LKASKDNVVVVIASVPESTESVGDRLVAIHHVMKLLYSENVTQGPVVVMSRYDITSLNCFNMVFTVLNIEFIKLIILKGL